MGLGPTHCKYHMGPRAVYFKDSEKLDQVVVIIIFGPGHAFVKILGAVPTYCRHCAPVGPAHRRYCMGAGTITIVV